MLKRLLFIIPLLTLIMVCMYFILTTSPLVRYWADDFCAAYSLRVGGFFGAQVSWWNSWTGRYSYIAFLDIFELIGPWVVRILPIIIFVLLVVTLVPVFFFETILAPFLIVLILINAPNIIQSFYWQVGSLNYSFEFMFFNLFLAFLVWPRKKFALLTVFVFSLIASGFSEVYALAQVVMIIFILLLLIFGKFSNNKYRIKLAIAGLIGAILSLAIMSLSPGNAVRASSFTNSTSFYFVVKSTILGTKWYFERMFMVKPFVYSLILIASVCLLTVNYHWGLFKKAYFGTKRIVLLMVISIASAVSSTAAVIFSGYYTMAITPPERTMFIAIYMILISFFAFCLFGSILLLKFLKPNTKKYFLYFTIITVVFFSGILIKSVVRDWSLVRSQLSTYAERWDSQARILEDASETATIKNIKPVGELDGFTENNGWVLSCVESFYELKKIKLDLNSNGI